MCGISGIVYRDRERIVCSRDLRKMCATLVHRGPDDEGFFIAGNVGLGIRRLNVIDLVTGNQPISNEDGRIWVVFNGEIYNYRDLRQELEGRGHRFSSDTDTETIVHAYEEYGEKCVTKLNGMFAFAIWDDHKQALFLARDRVGVKPLFYFIDDSGIFFGSELKALLACETIPKELDREALDSFLTFEYVPAPLSIFKGVKKLLPGHTLSFRNGAISMRQYWEVPYHTLAGSEEDLRERFYDLLKDAVRLRLVSDVPLGAFLSGGVDSSSIVCLMNELVNQPVRTFSIGFDDPSYNELPYARLVANYLGTEHHELTIRPNIPDLVAVVMRQLDEPLADVSILPTYLISKFARQYVVVVLSGDGGDELFAGYEWYIANKLARYYQWLPDALTRRWIPRLVQRVPPADKKKGVVNKFKRFVEGAALPDELRHFRWNTFATEQTKSRLYTRELYEIVKHSSTCARVTDYLHGNDQADPLWQEQFADIKTYLTDDILAKVDRMSMANSLEARTPFLDYRVLEFAAGLPSRLKLRGFKSKYLLKRSMASNLPREILNRKKEGFSIPIKQWLKDELRPIMQEVLSPARIRRGDFFNSSYIETLKNEHLNGTANHSHQLWSLMVFEMWRETYLS